MGKSFTNIKGRTSNKKAAGQKKIRPRTVTAAIIRSIRVSVDIDIDIFSDTIFSFFVVKTKSSYIFIYE